MAGKLFAYMFLIVGLTVLFNIAGLTTGDAAVTTGQWQLSTLTGITGFKDNGLWNWFNESGWKALGLGIGVIVAGLLARLKGETAIAAAIATAVLVAFIGDLVLVVRTVSESSGANWITYLILILAAPIIVGFVIALWDWVVGKE